MTPGLNSWPNAAVDFLFEETGGGAQRGLTLVLAFDGTTYVHDDARERAAQDAATYEAIAGALREPDARVTLQSSLDSHTPHAIDPAALAAFAAGVAAYLLGLADGATPGSPEPLTIHVAMEPENADDIFRLSTDVTISTSDAKTVSTIAPRPMAAFASAFEAAYAGADVFFKVLFEGKKTDVAWAMRFRRQGAPAGPGVTFAVPGPARYYAPVPLSNVPVSRSDVPVVRYDPAKGIDWENPDYVRFSAVDMDRWARSVFAAIDLFLATHSGGAQSEDVRKLSQIRFDLAVLVASTLEPIIAQASTPPSSAARENAVKTLRQQMFVKAESAYEIAAICQFEAAVTSRYEDDPAKGVYGPRLSGTLTNAADGAARFSTVRSVLAPGKAFVSSALTQANTEAQTRLPLELAFHIEHVLYAGAPEYLSFVVPFDAAIGPVEVPLVLRALPAEPLLVSQEAVPAEQPASDLAAARRWTYAFAYDATLAEQDALDISVAVNTASEDANVNASDASAARDLDLFDYLARIVSVLPVMLQHTAAAIGDFTRLLEPLPQAWSAWRAVPRSAPLPADAEFLLQERCKDGLLVLTCTPGPDAASLPQPAIQAIGGAKTYTAQIGSAPGELQYVDETGEKLTCEAARNVTQRRVLFHGLDVSSHQNASAAVRIARNRGFAEPFVYSAESRFAAVVTPRLSSGERFDVSLLSSPRQQTFATHLGRLLETLYKGTRDGTTQSLRLDAAFMQRVSDDLPEIAVPVLAGFEVRADSERAREVANQSAAIALKWYEANRPSGRGFRFALTLFGSLNPSQSPLLELRNVELELNDITDLPC